MPLAKGAQVSVVLDGKRWDDLMANHSVNAADCIGNSYGVVEALTSGLFVWFAFWMRRSVAIVGWPPPP